MMRKIQPLMASLLLVAWTMTIVAQVPASKPAAGQGVDSQDEKVSITTNLVQIDVTVTDKEGKRVTDLRPEDFEITEDGKRQALTNFSYVSNSSPTSSATIEPGTADIPKLPKSADDLNEPPPPPAALRPNQVRRTLAFLVDDLGISLESINFVRKALREFVDKQMQPGDLVVILRTSGGTGALQQFTTDKRFLHAAIDGIRWLPRGRGEFSSFDAISPTNNQMTDVLTREIMQDMQAFRAESLAIGTIGTLNLLLRNLAGKPGRKSVILFSENFRIQDYNKQRSERLLQMMKELADYSNRASAVVYTVDTSGVQPLAVTAGDSPLAATVIPEFAPGGGAGPPPAGTRAAAAAAAGRNAEDGLRALSQLADQARASYFESQSVLNYLAKLTGGINIRNTNNIGGGIERILEDQNGYYLLAYRPDEPPVDPKTGQRRPLKLKVKVNRPGLNLRTRNSYYGMAPEEQLPAGRTRDQQLQAALNSPFAGDMRMRLTSLFGKDQGKNSFVRAIVYVDARDMKFQKGIDETYKAKLDMAVLTIDFTGRVIDQVNRTETVSAKGEAYNRLLQQGLTYVLNVPVKMPGPYQVRVAIRDAATEKTGSASQFVEIPNLATGGLTLSGIILYGLEMKAIDNDKAQPDTQAGPAVRRLRHGMALDYGYLIYNAQLDKPTKKPKLTIQVKVFRAGNPFFTGRVVPLDVSQQTDMKKIVAGGRLLVANIMIPGDYVLQVTVTDTLVKEKSREKRRTATQWIDFEVVK